MSVMLEVCRGNRGDRQKQPLTNRMQGYNQWETKESFVKELVPELSLEEGRVKEAVQRKAAHGGTAHTEKRERGREVG